MSPTVVDKNMVSQTKVKVKPNKLDRGRFPSILLLNSDPTKVKMLINPCSSMVIQATVKALEVTNHTKIKIKTKIKPSDNGNHSYS
ncbi:MAG: hypothetical protein Q9222_000908 [Ikaeria aurantiellina]